MNLYSSTYLDLIHIGETSSLDYKEEILKYFPIGSSAAWQLYNENLTQHFTHNEIISLFKGLVICEKAFQWHCGSTTPTAHLYQDIKRLGLDPDDSLADWAFKLSDNEYIPFGFIRHGEKSAYEYLQWREDFQERVAQEYISKKERKRQQLERAKKIAQEKKEKELSIHEYYSRIKNLTSKEQINIIVSDEEHLVYFYVPVIFQLLKREDISKNDLEKLLCKLTEMKETPFRKKVTKLIVEKMASTL